MGKLLPSQKRIVGVFGHHGCGKTTFLDTVLVNYGGADRIGQRYLDIEQIEKEKAASFSNHLFTVEHNNTRVCFMDTPGSIEFLGDIRTAIYSVDNVLLVLNAESGLEVTAERVWKVAQEFKKPVMIYVNGIEKEGVNFSEIVKELKASLQDGMVVVPAEVPVGEGANFRGVASLMTHKAYMYDKSGIGQETELPPEAQMYYDEFHTELVEDIVENDDFLVEKYFEAEEDEELMEKYFGIGGEYREQLIKCMHKSFIEGKLVPVMVGSAIKNIGTDRIIDAIIEFGETPEEHGFETLDGEPIEVENKLVGLIIKNAVDPFVGKLTYVRILSGDLKAGDNFNVVQEDSNEKVAHLYLPGYPKNTEIDEVGIGDIVVIPKLKASKIGQTIAAPGLELKVKMTDFPEPMISKSINPKSKNDIDKLTGALAKLSESDPTFSWDYESETGETVMSGVGQIHLDVMAERIKKNFNVEFEVGKPKIAYRETIRKKTQSEYKHKKQTGGHGQYGHVKIELEPVERGTGYEFVDKIVGGVIPKNFIPSVDKGIREAIKKGPLAAFPVVDVKITLYDGSYHDVDSSDMAFQIAGRGAFRDAVEKATPVLLEPIMHVEVYTPFEATGGVMGEITAKRGRPMGSENAGKGTDKIVAEIPLAEMLDFSPRLSSITAGKGYFTMKFSHYMEVPADQQAKIIKERQAELAQPE